MKKILAVLTFFTALVSYAQTAASFGQTATVLGIPEGVYTGADVLVSQTFLVPNFDIKTQRTLRAGVITANTKAYFFGHQVGGAAARLHVVSTGPQNFNLEDLDRPDGKGGYARAGQGSCTPKDCTFAATVMNGTLTLRETWSRGGPNEYFITKGWQSLSGVIGTYTGRLTKAN